MIQNIERDRVVTYLDANQDYLKPGVVCLGFFDGVHLGHQAIIKEGKDEALRLHVPLYIHTYDVPPIQVIKQGLHIKEISSLDEKVDLLQQAGADIVAISRFDDKLMHMSGDDFFLRVLLEQLQARHLVIGCDHRFGFKGRTDAAALRDLCNSHHVGLSIVPAVRLSGVREISSTAIRKALALGDITSAEEMLGRKVSHSLLQRFMSSGNDIEKVEEGFE
ncbi:MAG: FAD synthetase family protein [Clostridiales bacterium]|nr:FAD synthetase family protein [Clostridiales bacterium]